MTRSDPTIITSWDHPIMLPTSPRPAEPTSSSSSHTQNEPTSSSHTHHQCTHPSHNQSIHPSSSSHIHNPTQMHSTPSHIHNQTQIQILTQLTQDPTPTHILVGRQHDPSTHIVGKHQHIDDDDMEDTESDVNDEIDKSHHLNIPRYRSRSFSSASSSSSSSSSSPPPHRDLSPSPRTRRDDWSHHISSPTQSNPSSQHTSSTTSLAVSSSPSPSASPSSFASRSPTHMISSRRISSLSSSSSHMSSPHSYTSSPLRRHRQLHPISPDILSPCALELGVIAMHHGRPHFPHTPSEPNSPLLENRIISCSAPSSTLIKSRLLSTSSSTSSSSCTSSTSSSTPASPSHASMSSSPLSLKPRYLHSPQQTNSVLAMKQRSNSWSSIASTYAQFFHEYFTRFAEIAMHMVMERCPWSPDAYILDVGAGTGALSLTTARHGYRTVAIDYSPDMIQILNAKRTQQHLSEAILHSVIMDAQAMGFPDSRFDVVFAMFCVMLFPSKTIGLTEMYRVLKPGGYMVMTLWDDEYATEWNVLHTQAMRLVRPDRGFDMITHSHDRDATVALLQSVGFTNVEMTPGVSLTYTVEDPTSFWHALAQVTSTRFLLDTYFTKQQQQRVQHTFISLLQQRGDPETGIIKLTGRATFYIAQKPLNATSTPTIVKNDVSSVIASSSTPSSSISLVTIPSPVPSLYPPTCVSPPISISSSSSSCSSDSPSSSFKLPPPVTSTSPAMSCSSSTSMDVPEDPSTS